ncbi:competence protein CoiA [Campylobacter hyointestinalis]|uniref:competence protein CoiA n=1 Tax=Campylobacter hyointestinalis TaxID=198 RepID=UPI001BD47E9D|nr:competence protein CoiA [Campylobacter hyointestinalis]MBT0611963.1 competence protein CoiA [Campylobacter hyointestinalis subsp. hyointestinalis]MDY2999471.1 competence protein CoiA [Campylobacter hyointestinalis]
MDEILTEIRRYNKLKMIADDEIIPYVEMADFEIEKYSIDDKNLLKARAFYTIGLLGQKLWLKIQQRANEYDESLDTFKDVKQWEEYWMDKFYKLTTKKNTSGYFYAAV